MSRTKMNLIANKAEFDSGARLSAFLLARPSGGVRLGVAESGPLPAKFFKRLKTAMAIYSAKLA